MHKLVYWVARRIDDSQCFNLRDKSKQKLLRRLEVDGLVLKKHEDHEELVYCRGNTATYEQPRKVVVTYTDRMDLVNQLLGEGGVE